MGYARLAEPGCAIPAAVAVSDTRLALSLPFWLRFGLRVRFDGFCLLSAMPHPAADVSL